MYHCQSSDTYFFRQVKDFLFRLQNPSELITEDRDKKIYFCFLVDIKIKVNKHLLYQFSIHNANIRFPLYITEDCYLKTKRKKNKKAFKNYNKYACSLYIWKMVIL